MKFNQLWQKIKIQWAKFRCDNCQKDLGGEDVLLKSSESGEIVCPACSHRHEIRLLDENHPFYGFDHQAVQACETVHLMREESISIVEKKWKNKFIYVWSALSLGIFLIMAGFAYIQWSQFANLGFEVLAAIAILGFALLATLFKFLQFWLNHTKLMLKRDRLVIGHLPISFLNYQVVMFENIKGFSMWKRLGQVGPLSFRFGLFLVTKDEKEIFISPCSEISEALYLEKTLLELIQIEQTELKETEEF